MSLNLSEKQDLKPGAAVRGDAAQTREDDNELAAREVSLFLMYNAYGKFFFELLQRKLTLKVLKADR